MINNLPQYIWRFIYLVLLQGLVLNNINIAGYGTPYLYVIFILSLPLKTPKQLVLIIAFFLGLSVDLFTHTFGLNAAATVALAFFQPFILNLLSPRDGYERIVHPTPYNLGLVWYLSYVGSLILIHNLFLYFIETFRFSEFFYTFSKALASSVFTMILILIMFLLGFSKKSSNA